MDRTYRQYWGGGTSYLSGLQWIVDQVEEFKGLDLGRPGDPLSVKFQTPYPLFAIFVTDGEPMDDREAVREYLRRMSQLPIFVQFVGVGRDTNFDFLQSLNTLGGRLIDNAGFFNAMDVLEGKKRFGFGRSAHQDPQTAVFDGLLNEFPGYYPQARKVGLIG